VHFRHYPYPWAHLPGTALNPPPHLVLGDTVWVAVPLDESDKQAKEAAIVAYGSQTAIADLGLYMRAFVRTNELFAERAPSREGQGEEGRPSEGTTVAVTPRPVVPPAPGSTRPRIAWTSVDRGPDVWWIGLHCDAKVSPQDTFRVGLRLFGEGEKPARLDISARGTEVTVLSLASNSIVPKGIQAEADGDVMWITVPAAVFDGRTRAMIGAAAGRADYRPLPSAWREVEL
jgi:hypothetical protein